MKQQRTILWMALAIGIGVAASFGVRHPDDTPKFVVPKGWPKPQYDFSKNPITPAGFALGRKLFYDAQLSRDGSVSCGSCHQQFAAFAQLDHRVSHGIGGINGKRNAPGLFNLAWQPQLMWDGAATHLETQPILPISNPLEMGETLADVVNKLKANPAYTNDFEQAFGTTEIDSQKVLFALAQFTGTLISNQSRYDRYIANEEKFSKDEVAGLGIFREHCASCHQEPLFTDFSYRSNGLDAVVQDAGRGDVTARPEDHGRFRVPSLRNVALTSPYMHDGRYDTLEQVLDHYGHGVVASIALDPLLKKGITLGKQQRRELLAFLNTLTDQQFVQDVRFADIGATQIKQTSLAAEAFNLLAHAGFRDADAHASPALGKASLLAKSHLSIESDKLELVLDHQDQDLVIYADDIASNAPLNQLSLSVRSGNQLLQAAEDGNGVYRIPAERFDFSRPQRIDISVRAAGFSVQLQATLPAEAGALR